VALVSWSIHREDILLARALRGVHHDEGFYIDVGANNPNEDSVTKLFYDHGWHGLNVEPSQHWYNLLVHERPRDINIHAAVSDQPGTVILYDHPEGGLGTIVQEYADRHRRERNISTREVEVEAVTLTSLCERYAPQQIHFLKIDVEGFEENVIRSMDFARFRPWILCVEATEPMRLDAMTHGAWDPLLIDAGYKFVQFDGQNRWYVSNEHPERMSAVDYRFDDYSHWTHARQIQHLESRVLELQSELNSTREQLGNSGGHARKGLPEVLLPSMFSSQKEVRRQGDDWLLSFEHGPTCLVYGPYIQLPPGEREVIFQVQALGLGEQALQSSLVFDVAADGVRRAWCAFEGRDGATSLRDGEIKLRFHNESPMLRFEFRIYAAGKPYDGQLVFTGARVL
jgi:FkbM family methyltransferase